MKPGKMKRIPIRYELSSYRGVGTEPETRSLTGPEKNTVDAQSFDHMMDYSRGIYGFRTAAGHWVEYPIKGSGMGRVCLDIAEAVKLNPGVFLDGKDLSELTGNENLLSDNAISSRVTKLRRAHAELPGESRFFMTASKPYSVQWPAERTWLVFRRILAPVASLP